MRARLMESFAGWGGSSTLQRRIDTLTLGDNAVAIDVMHALIETNRTTLVSMRLALRSGEWRELGRAAHRLSGSLRMLAFTRGVDWTQRLERASTEHDVAAVVALLPAVEAFIDILNDALAQLLEHELVR